MILPDVNVLIYAHREESERHDEYRDWLTSVWESPAAFAVSDMTLSGCLRILTHRRVFSPPTPLRTAIDFVNQVRNQPNAVHIQPGRDHWRIFTDLCNSANAKGNLIPDAFLAALAIESGSELITTDRDFARFPRLQWRHPLD